MPARRTKKSGNQGRVKFPKDAVPLKKLAEDTAAKKDITKDVESVSDSVMGSEWMAWNSRPSSDLFGYLVVAKWNTEGVAGLLGQTDEEQARSAGSESGLSKQTSHPLSIPFITQSYFCSMYKEYPKLNSWALLYVTRGQVGGILSKMFSGRCHSAIGRYVSSFSKTDRGLLWMKWFKDPYYPYESVDIEDIISALGVLYNQGERPAFNFTDKDFQPEIPENFSILDYA